MNNKALIFELVERQTKVQVFDELKQKCDALIKEFDEALRAGNHYERWHIYVKIVDVSIMLEKIKVLYDVDDFQLDIIATEKICREHKEVVKDESR